MQIIGNRLQVTGNRQNLFSLFPVPCPLSPSSPRPPAPCPLLKKVGEFFCPGRCPLVGADSQVVQPKPYKEFYGEEVSLERGGQVQEGQFTALQVSHRKKPP